MVVPREGGTGGGVRLPVAQPGGSCRVCCLGIHSQLLSSFLTLLAFAK